MVPVAHAAAADEAVRFVDAINDAILFPLILLMIGIALVVFFYGAFEYVMGANNEQKRDQGRKHLLYGIIGFLVMISAMAILQIAAATLPGARDPRMPAATDGLLGNPGCEVNGTCGL